MRLTHKLRRSALTVTVAAAAMLVSQHAYAAPGHITAADDVASTIADVAPDAGAPAATQDQGSALTAALPDGSSVSIPDAADGAVTLAAEGKETISVSLPEQAAVTAPDVADDGTVVYEAAGSGVDVAVQALTTGDVSIQTVLASADSARSFTYTVDGLTPIRRPDGGVDLISVSTDVGTPAMFVGEFKAPWAFDANGKVVATSYVVEGNTVTQVVEVTADTAFPVVADPTYGHTYGIPTAYLNWSETKTAANPDYKALTLICATVGAALGAWAGVLCGANMYTLNNTAIRAVNNGKCMKIVLGVGVSLGQQYNC